MNNLTGKDPITLAIHKMGTVEFIRKGAYCNLNDIAKPFGKRVDNWTRLKSTQDLLEAFKSEPCYSGLKPIEVRYLRSEGTGQFGSGGGLYAHPDIAIQFAQWCSPGFALWVSRQIRHILEYGEANLHYQEWSAEQIECGLEYNREDADELYGW